MNAATRKTLEKFVSAKTIDARTAENVKSNFVKPLTIVFGTLAEKVAEAPVGSPDWNYYCDHINPAWNLLIAAEYVCDGILQPNNREAYFKAADTILDWN